MRSSPCVAVPLTTDVLASQIQTGWTLMCAALVLLMQAGFCCLEAGAVRHKNSINVAIKNVVDLCISFPAFYVVGYALMFGADRFGIYGAPVLFLSDKSAPELTAFFFQAAFCATAATIVSGGVAERCRFLPYLFVTLAISLVIYPLFGHAVWGGGILAKHGFHDFAGSSVVHMVGAGVTLAGIQVLGPRNGRFGPDGKPRAVPASSMPLVALGVMLLVFGWIGFNGGSAPLGDKTALIITNTILAGCFGGLGALLSTWAYRGLAAVDLILNGLLGGLVAITACADVVTLHAAALIGMLGGVVVVMVSALLEKLKLDDAVGAVPVHGGAGITGILCTAAFATPDTFESHGLTRLGFLSIQVLGAAGCVLWAYGLGYIVWWLVGKISPLRVGSIEESVGMNFSEHQVASPMQALTHSVLLAREGQPREGQPREGQPREGHARLDMLDRHGSFDDIPDGQFDALAQAVRELVRDTGLQLRRKGQWSTDLDAISGTLDQNQRVGREAIESYRDEVTNLDRSLYHIARHLSEGRVDPTTLTVAVDSVTNLRRRLELLQHKLPSTMDSWEQISRMAERIDRLASTMRGDVRDTH